jgi:hypothetical protein
LSISSSPAASSGSPLYGKARTLIVRIVQMLTQLGGRMATTHASSEEL